MKKTLSSLLVCFFLYSCIPLRVAPQISDYKLMEGSKFKRSLSKRNMFIFEDPKEAGEFYTYVNSKYQLEHINVFDDVPFIIEGNHYFFAFYELEIQDKTLNLFPILLNETLNAALNNEEETEYDGSQHIDRRRNWYIAIEVYSDREKDCLVENSLSRAPVLQYLRFLKKEYLSTANYNELVFKN